MIITLKTARQSLNNLMEIPFLGALIIFLLAMAPVPLLFISNAIFPFAMENYLEKIVALIAGIWNAILAFGFKITIGIFMIPCWLLFLIIGLYRYFWLKG
ncbi:hypothetical protein [Sphingobacterium athyrii]|uniref:hypothetical protein n=1 Tax=Sphingobacterium athyrii TaxID=2152717 RepID=UPI0028AC11A2|nr:hypothetical protein [Sphingobacterium athyrii]